MDEAEGDARARTLRCGAAGQPCWAGEVWCAAWGYVQGDGAAIGGAETRDAVKRICYHRGEKRKRR